ncbi:MAG TPA: hypothetical protein PLZ08_08795 [Bacillota bacterium]|jgi:photosystem II stability/assembly factor-like uncharacterized protein|nr:hypothetical protein [Bacillota bacterium]HOL09083.1 hypothetical protein [Bacillota bacterium]HPO98039.1 hypothetical protein [Bacillota bacterium]
MRKALLIVVGLIFFCSLVKVNALQDFGPWETELQLDINHPCTIAGFVSGGMIGISVGEDGQCYYTMDSGNTWVKTETNTSSRYGIDLSLYQTVFTCGTDGKVRISTNNGRSWEERADFIPSGNLHCRYLSFCNIFTGWIAAPDSLGMTKDSGRSWTGLNLPEGINRIDAIALRTPTEGYLLDASDNGVLYITEDGGVTWRKISIGLQGESLEISQAPTAAMRFTSADNGIIIINRKFKTGIQIWAAITKDGGSTWQHERVPGEYSHLFLARDGLTLTLTNPSKKITVLKRKM